MSAQYRTRHTARQQGFTLIELLITIAIMAILAAIAFPSFQTFIQRARMDNARAVMTDVIKFMERHYNGGVDSGAANPPTAQPTATFCAAQNAAATRNATCAGPDISSILDPNSNSAAGSLRYNIALHNVTANNFILIATPRPGMYSDSTLASTNLNILYDSSTATFARCNTAGIGAARSNSDPDSNCEVF